jgi:RNA polymerase sigma-70 factor (ECF subfamily)
MNPDTEIGGERKDFPSTLWGDVLDTAEGDAPRRQAAWERLAQRYWKPIYAVIRSAWSKSSEEAKDLTQEFFAWMIETGFPARADAERGSFRAFVKSALRNFLSNEGRDRRRLKRGGQHAILRLREELDEGRVRAAEGASADEILRRAWREEILVRAQQILKDVYEREGKETYFRLFHDYYLKGPEAQTYRDLASLHGIQESTVHNYLTDARRRFRAVLVDLVAETVGSPDELRAEINELFGVDPP